MGKWMYNINESDIWEGEEFDTKEQAISEGNKVAMDEGVNKFYIGETDPTVKFGIDVEKIIEDIQQFTYDDIGEVAECYLDDVKEEHLSKLEEKLNEVFFKWQKEYGYEPDFYKIINIEEINI